MDSTQPPPQAQTSLRTCQVCGNPTAAENPRCVHCGAVSIEAVVEQRRAASERRFIQALFTRSNPFTMILIGINVGVYALMCLAGGIALTSVDNQVLVGFGAKQNELIAQQHQYWRLVTSIFIHIGIIHLFINNYALWIIGQEIERIYGSARFIALYLITGILGSTGSYVFNPQATSAGASGAIFGLFGVMATFAFRYRSEIPPALSREIKRRIIPVIALNLIFGLSVAFIDNAAHIGGLISGCLLALVVPYKRPTERGTPFIWRALQVGALSVILVCFVLAFSSYKGPSLRLSNLTSKPSSNIVAYFDHMQDANSSLVESFKLFTSIVESGSSGADVNPVSEQVERGLAAVKAVPSVDSRADQYRDELAALLSKQSELVESFKKSSTKDWTALEQGQENIVSGYGKFSPAYNEWLVGFLKDHGFELRDH